MLTRSPLVQEHMVAAVGQQQLVQHVHVDALVRDELLDHVDADRRRDRRKRLRLFLRKQLRQQQQLVRLQGVDHLRCLTRSSSAL